MDLGIRKTAFSPSEDQSWLGSAHGTNTAKPVTLDGDAFIALFPDGVVPSGTILRNLGNQTFGPRSSAVTDEIQTVTITGTPTGGTFTLTYAGQTTAAIPYNATAAQVEAALDALSNLDDVVVTGGPGPGTPYSVRFAGTEADEDVAQMTATGSFTGGTTPAVAVTTATAGGAESPASAAAGILLTTKSVRAGARIPGAMLWHGDVIISKLPRLSGYDASVATDLPQIRFH